MTQHRPTASLVLLVRHGQTATTGKVLPGRAPGLHLSDRGRKQAEQVAARLADVPGIAAIYSSPLERTRETATPIGRALRHTVQRDRGLLECDFGDWTGVRLATLAKRPEWRTVQRSPSVFRFPNGESFVEMQTRAVAAVHRLAGKHPGETIVCVSHADPIKAVVAQAMGLHLDLFQRVVINPCSVSAILFPTGSSPVVLCVNSTAGLADLTVA